MENCTWVHLLLFKAMTGNNKLVICLKGDQVTHTSGLTFIQMDLNKMSIHYKMDKMFQVGNRVHHNQKMDMLMDKQSHGNQKDTYSLVNSIITILIKENYMRCNKITHILSTL
jgi:hypothetical protein